ncbi:MAG: squalene--hopene cyclase [Acidobacteria bacterium]|nr:MAG: squalene--hopene cyclase [Acidobacteriota bacterium]
MQNTQQALLEDLEPQVDERPSSATSALRRAIAAARRGLVALQREDGHWCAELEGDTILESEYILTLHFLGLADPQRVAKLANFIRRQQLPAGGWTIAPGCRPDVSSSVKAYLALKLAGDDPAAEHMVRAREAILRLGGIEACNSFTKIYLSIFGLYDWRRCPAVVPEMILMPRWFYFNIYAMSSWSRAIVIPLAIIWAKRPLHRLGVDLDDLAGAAPVPEAGGGSFKRRFWSLVFRAINGGLHLLESARLLPLRRRALARCEQWVLDRLEDSDGVGAIFPPIINTLIGFRSLGYPMDHPVIQSQLHELEKLEVDDGDEMRVQPCFSPVWDTAIALDALGESGMERNDAVVQRAGRWLLEREIKRPGDVQILYPEVPSEGCWFFEYRNAFYPDCDDTAEVLKALSRVRFDAPETEGERRAAIERGLSWLRAMQNDDGGWAAFDKNCNREILTYVPFADHNAMIDPSTSDITARVLEVMLHLGVDRRAPEIQRALAFLRREQEADGSWYGRWGCNYLYGTWLALQALAAAGEDEDRERIARAAAWLRRVQNDDGGWGELPLSYDDPTLKGQGPSTASQTAWALMGLAAAGEADSEAVERGIAYLLAQQREDGTWQDEHWTGTGFPKVFYLRYHLYATYFPLGALSVIERRMARAGSARALREWAVA